MILITKIIEELFRVLLYIFLERSCRRGVTLYDSIYEKHAKHGIGITGIGIRTCSKMKMIYNLSNGNFDCYVIAILIKDFDSFGMF